MLEIELWVGASLGGMIVSKWSVSTCLLLDTVLVKVLHVCLIGLVAKDEI